MDAANLPTLRSLWHVLETEQSTIEFLLSHTVLDIPSVCSACSGNISVHGIRYQCTRKSCRKKGSCLRHSFFSGSRIKVNDVLLLGYLWLSGCSYSTALGMTGHSTGTITSYFSYFRQLVADSLDSEDWTIGGPGVVVQVDESKFGKRKYNRGHRIEGAWVIGGMECTAERKFFVRVIERRDSETICDVLNDHILPGSIVHTDFWRGYLGIDEVLEVQHRRVNHRQSFVDPHTGVHTNAIEAKWGALKRKITLRGRVSDTLPNHLFEQIWRHRNKDALWDAFISALKEVYYD